MKKIVILGRGGAGKSTLAKRLSSLTNIPYVELDKHFWKPGLLPTPVNEWKELQCKLTKDSSWIMDGDLGEYDALEVRLSAADTVIVLDFPLLICLTRAIKRSPERFDFWWWLITWRLLSRPKLMRSIKSYASSANLRIFRNPDQLEKFLSSVEKLPKK